MIIHQFQPTNKTCGQTCVSMITGMPVLWVQVISGSYGTTWAPPLRKVLHETGYKTHKRKFKSYKQCPSAYILMLRNDNLGSYGHWVLVHNNKVYDPALGEYTLISYNTRLKKDDTYPTYYISVLP